MGNRLSWILCKRVILWKNYRHHGFIIFTNAPNEIIPNIVEANVPYQGCINIMKSNIIWYKYKEKKNY